MASRRSGTTAPRTRLPDAALTPEAREAARKAMQNVTADLGGFSLDNIGPVALAEGPDAHTKTEIPKVPNQSGNQSRSFV